MIPQLTRIEYAEKIMAEAQAKANKEFKEGKISVDELNAALKKAKDRFDEVTGATDKLGTGTEARLKAGKEELDNYDSGVKGLSTDLAGLADAQQSVIEANITKAFPPVQFLNLVQKRIQKLAGEFEEFARGVVNIAEINADTEKTIALNKLRKEEEVAIEGKTAKQKEKIQKDFEQRREAIEKAAFEKNKKLSILQIKIDEASAVMKLMSKAGGIVTAAPQLLLLHKLAQAQIANVEAQEFAEGTPFVDMMGAKRGKDTIPAMLSRGEAVIPVMKNKKYEGLAGAMIEDRVAEWIAMNPQFTISNNPIFDDDRIVREQKKQTRVMRENNQIMAEYFKHPTMIRSGSWR